MATVQDIISRSQGLVDDPGGINFATPDYLTPFVQLAGDEVFAKLADYDLGFDEVVTVLPSVPAGTPNLSDYQASGNPLELLYSPIKVEWRLPGTDDTQWAESARYDVLPDQVNTQGITGWEYRKSVIVITPSTIAVDIRVRAEMLNSPLRGVEDSVANVAVLTMGYKVAELVGISRGNDKWVQIYGSKGLDALDSLERKLVKQDQGTPRGFGGSRGKSGGNPGFPIAH